MECKILKSDNAKNITIQALEEMAQKVKSHEESCKEKELEIQDFKKALETYQKQSDAESESKLAELLKRKESEIKDVKKALEKCEKEKEQQFKQLKSNQTAFKDETGKIQNKNQRLEESIESIRLGVEAKQQIQKYSYSEAESKLLFNLANISEAESRLQASSAKLSETEKSNDILHEKCDSLAAEKESKSLLAKEKADNEAKLKKEQMKVESTQNIIEINSDQKKALEERFEKEVLDKEEKDKVIQKLTEQKMISDQKLKERDRRVTLLTSKVKRLEAEKLNLSKPGPSGRKKGLSHEWVI